MRDDHFGWFRAEQIYTHLFLHRRMSQRPRATKFRCMFGVVWYLRHRSFHFSAERPVAQAAPARLENIYDIDMYGLGLRENATIRL